jgi:hypothetical protein
MPPVRKALVRNALREDAENVVFGDRDWRAPLPDSNLLTELPAAGSDGGSFGSTMRFSHAKPVVSRHQAGFRSDLVMHR